MSITKNIQMSEFNRIDYDILLPQTRLDFELGNEYVWEKDQNVETVNESVAVSNNETFWISKRLTSQGQTENIEYSDTVSIVNGEIVLNNPSVLIASYNNNSGVTTLIGKYVKLNAGSMCGYGGQVVHIDSGVNDRNYGGGGYWFGLQSCTAYLVNIAYKFVTAGYVNSSDPSAYPPSVPDGYTYTALGQLGAKVQIKTGSYIGTGTYGSSNPNSLTFAFEPKLVIVYPKSLNGLSKITTQSYWLIFTQFAILRSESSSNGFGASCDAPLAWGNTLTWWTRSNDSGAASYQGNVLNSVYQYIAIG